MKKIGNSINLLCVVVFLIFSLNSHGKSELDELIVTFNGKSLKIEEALSWYVRIKSESGNEKAAGEWLKALCLENGLFVKEMGNENGNYNFSASLYPLEEGKPNIIFLNHIDIVPAKQLSEWEYDPYSGTIKDGVLWGRGAYDNKGNAIMQLYSLLEIKRQNLNRNLEVNLTMLAVSGEETQAPGGVRFVVKNYLDELNPMAIIGEGPPGMTDVIESPVEQPVFCISVANKRPLWLKLELETNTLGHGSVSPNHYANKELNVALYRVLKRKRKFVYNDHNVELLKQMSSLYTGTKKFALKHPKLFKPFLKSKIKEQPEMFALFSNTITLTSLESSTHTVNSIPTKVTALLDCRLLPDKSKEEFLKELKRDLNNDNIKISVLKETPRVKPSSINSEVFTSIDRAIQQVYPESFVFSAILPNSTDSSVFRQKGIPAYDIIPIVLEKKYLESIHNVNERIPVKILDQGKNTYVRFIDELLKTELAKH